MHDIASQLVLKWARMGPSHTIPATQDFTRLTLDTIALCAMDFRFNSFYQDEMHPFVGAMTRVLKSRSQATQISSLFQRMTPSYKAGLEQDSEYQKQVAEELVRVRRENPTEKKDLLNAMIYGKDPKTGQTMSDELIAANMLTFLIAGKTFGYSSPSQAKYALRARDNVRVVILCCHVPAEESHNLLCRPTRSGSCHRNGQGQR